MKESFVPEDKVTLNAHSRPTILERFTPFGIYTLEAFAPLKVKDVDEVIRYFKEHGWERFIPAKHRIEQGIIPFKVWNWLQQCMPTRIRHEMDQLIDNGGNCFWSDVNRNRVVNTGLNDVLDKWLKGSSYTAAHYVGLTDGTPTTAATNTMALASRAWTEVVAYDEATRQSYTPGTVASQTVNNSASKATFTCSTNSTTIGGAFIATSSTKSEVLSTLESVEAASGGDVTINDGDTLTVQIDFTAADS